MSVVPKINSPVRAGWQPGANRDVLQKRAALLTQIRAFFAERSILEVETPILSCAATPDPVLESFQTTYTGPGFPDDTPLFLHTSPEFFMKRLLAAGSGSIYQFARVFRNNESGHRHNPEFTLLEWYREGFSYHVLMDEVEALLKHCCKGLISTPIRRVSYRDLFKEFAFVDPFEANNEELSGCMHNHGHDVSAGDAEQRQFWLDLILTHVIEPKIHQGAFFVFDYPADQAALAKIRADDPPVAERFELYINGVELANGFQELSDSTEQRKRFASENHKRTELGIKPVPIDELLLQALESGLPDCAGVAIGFDRLVMLATGQQHIDKVMAFPLSRI
jgi:lysyl-tRNA synthetase class 2